MSRRRRSIDIFNLSFLDVVSCGFGAIILLLVIVKVSEPHVIEKLAVDLSGLVQRLGKELHEKHGEKNDAAIRELVLRCLNREPRPEELISLSYAHDDFSKMAKTPEAAMIATARIVMNLDEFITRE